MPGLGVVAEPDKLFMFIIDCVYHDHDQVCQECSV